MKAQIRQQMGQTLNLTPQLLQSIRLLQLTAAQLEQEVLSALELNPMLEREEESEGAHPPVAPGAEAEAAPSAADPDAPEPSGWDDPVDPAWSGSSGGPVDDPTALIGARSSSDPRVRLLELLAMHWNQGDLAVAGWWLDHCDDRGFLEEPLDVLLARGSLGLGLPRGELEVVRQRLLYGEWPGMAAVDVQESLLAQLSLLPEDPLRELAGRILESHLELLAAGDTTDLARALDEPAERVAAALALVRSLRPSPAEDLPAAPGEFIIPDVVAWKGGEQWHVALYNRSVPRVRIAAHCEQALAGARGGDTSTLRGLLEEARWLVRGLAMRDDTLLRTARVLVRRQQGFLERGEEAILPLTLQEVASEIEMHESTVSRITTGKYIQTPRGPLEMKRLFAARLDGASVSGVAVRAMVQRLIDQESPDAPLSDATIAAMLARQGIRLARRTVAKYREQLGIAPARSRARVQRTGT